MINPKILALDFDGVICNGVVEYFQSCQKAYQKIWLELPSNEYAPRFYKLRPVIEHGWEMPVLLKALILQYSDQDILHNWAEITHQIITTENLNPQTIAQQLDRVRDEAINNNLDNWLSLQTPYQGVIEKLQDILKSPTKLYIISTKEGRFIKQFLQNYNINLSVDYIIGKECKRPKYETLRLIIKKENINPREIWFVEDRLNTLSAIEKQPDLKDVQLYLADWGYNTEQMRKLAWNHDQIKLLSLDQFCQDFSQW
jgi:phosphoglycolate phosphatase-like HAD superfamily hydrolase